MSLCPVPGCGRAYCDHTPAERGQSHAEMMRDLTPEEERLRATRPPNDPLKQAMAGRNAHLPTDKP